MNMSSTGLLEDSEMFNPRYAVNFGEKEGLEAKEGMEEREGNDENEEKDLLANGKNEEEKKKGQFVVVSDDGDPLQVQNFGRYNLGNILYQV